MSQHDFDIANQTASLARADINLGLKALASLSSGALAPTTTYANMMWFDTTAKVLKLRSEANDSWINLGSIDPVSGEFLASIPLATQAEAEAGVEDTKAMTALRTSQAVTKREVGGSITSASRAFNTTYQNTQTRPIIVIPVISSTLTAALTLEISSNAVSWVPAFQQVVETPRQVAYSLVVPVGFYYRVVTSAGTGVVNAWREIY